MSKKVGEYTINRLDYNDEDEVIDRTEVASKPIWSEMFRVEENEDELWGWIYFYIQPTTWNEVYSFREEFNSEKQVNMKVKDKKDYYGNKKKQLYIPRPVDKMQDVFNQLPFTWEKNFGNYELIIERKEDIDWKTVRKEEMAKAL